MAIEIIVTTAGRAALINAVNTGTNAVTIAQLGITAAAFVPNAGQAALPGEIKRIASVAGVVVADDQIHVTASDVTTDAYTMRGFALYLADGTLFAIYGQTDAILNKTAESMMLLAADIAFADIDAALIEFGDTNFVLPPATTEILGLVELATTAEAQTGSDATRVLTPLTGKQSVLGWLLSQDGSGSGLDADLLDGLHASAFALAGHTHGTMAAQNANAVNITGGAVDGVTLSNISGPVGIACAALGSTKLQVRIGVDRRFSVFANGTDNVFGYLTDAGNWADTFMNGATLRFGIGGAERARFDPAGFLGINQTAPVARLHVKSGAEIARFESTSPRGSGQCYIALADPTGAKGYIGFANADDGMDIHNNMAAPIRFITNGTERARIAADGKITFNGAAANYFANFAASNPSRGIIADFANVHGAPNGAQISFTQNGISNWCIGQVPGTDAFAIYRGRNGASDGTEVVRWDAIGQMTVPLGKSVNFYTDRFGVGTPHSDGLQAYAATGDRIRLGHMAANGTFSDRLIVDGAGKVGIGKAPSEQLDVEGNVRLASAELPRLSLLRNGIGTWHIGGSGVPGDNSLNMSFNALPASVTISGSNVGIGTTAPARSLHVKANTEIARFETTTVRGSGNGYIGINDPSGRKGWWGFGGNDDTIYLMNDLNANLVLGTGGQSRLTIDTSGHLTPATHGTQILGWPSAAWKEGHFTDFLRVAGNGVWHAGNDGAGSGLDADLLDGLQASDFLKLSDFTGANQFMSSSGYQKLPGGLIIQWGSYFVGANSSTNVSFPTAFPNICTLATCSGGRADTAAQDNNPFVSGVSTTAATIFSSADTGVSGNWLAIGY